MPAIIGPSPFIDPPNFRTPVLDPATNLFTGPWQQIISQIVNLSNAKTATIVGSHGAKAVVTVQQAPEGTFYWEDDRNALYMSINSGSIQTVEALATWLYVGGFTQGFVSDAPTDLGAADIGFTFQEQGTNHLVFWNGVIWLFYTGDSGGGYIVPFGVGLVPQVQISGGWQVCDGSDTTYLQIGNPTLSLTGFTTPTTPGSYFRR